MAIAPVPDPFNMAAYVLGMAQLRGEKTALSILHHDRVDHISYAALEAAVRGVATGLLRRGYAAGDHVVIRLGNTADFPIAYLGCIAAGLVPAPVSLQWTKTEVAAAVARLRPVVSIQSDDMVCGVPVIMAASLRGFYALPPARYAMGDPHRAAYIIHTSGTSGKPQAVVHAHRAVWARQMMHGDWMGLEPDDRILHAGALNWTFTLGTGLMDPWSVGATALIPAQGTDATDLPALMARHSATIFAAAPAIYRRMLRAHMPDLPALRHGLSAGESLPAITRDAWAAQTGTQIHEAFGMTECSTFISGSPSRPAPRGTSGYAQNGRRVAVMGRDGSIAVHRDDPGLMLGYLDDPDATAAKFDGDWFLTGDLGQMACDGAITYAGRSDDMMNAGGIRVSPIEVEHVLAAYPEITDVACCAVAVKKDVLVIAAFYTSRHTVDDASLAAWCADQLADYKRPRLFVACDSLPRGANNKLLRRVLRQNWEAEHGQT